MKNKLNSKMVDKGPPSCDIYKEFAINKTPTHYFYGGRSGKFEVPDNMYKLFYKVIFEKKNYSGRTINQECGVVENKSEYYTLIFDLDYKDDEKTKSLLDNYNPQDITFYIIDKIEQVLRFFIEDPKMEYVYCDKNKGNGVHLYYPNLVINKELGGAIYEKLLEDIKEENCHEHIDKELWNSIIDPCTFEGNGLRIPYTFVNNKFYKVNKHLSTYKIKGGHLLYNQLDAVKISRKDTKFNFRLKEDKNKFPIYISYLEKHNNSKPKKDNTRKNIKASKHKTTLTIDKSKIGYKKDYFKLPISEKLFRNLCNNLKADRLKGLTNWRKFIYLCRNYGQKEICYEVCKKFPKFDTNAEKCIENLFSKEIRRENCMTLKSLFKWSSEDNKEKHIKYILEEKEIKMDHSDEYLLYNYRGEEDIIENTKYISDSTIDTIIKYNKRCIVLHSPTGSGKTTTTLKLIKGFYSKKQLLSRNILSIVSRRTMISVHEKSFNTKHANLKLKNYLEENGGPRFISSLEYLDKLNIADDKYHILILDEVNSLLNHFYSSTMDFKRRKCFMKFLFLVKNSELIIASDAYVTSSVYSFLDKLRTDIFRYRNTFKNKKDTNMIFYKCKEENDENKIYSISKMIIEKRKINKSILCLSDSKSVVEDFRSCLINLGVKLEDILLFTSEEGLLEELNNPNEVFKNKIVLSSPKIVYGLDVTIYYDNIFGYYKGDTLDSLSILQQIGRARECKNVHIIFPNNNFKNMHIDFDYLKERENKLLEDYSNELLKKTDENKYTLLASSNEMLGMIKYGMYGDLCIDSVFENLHYYKVWIEEQFKYNRRQLVEKIAIEAGYTIIKKDLEVNKILNIEKFNEIKEMIKEIKLDIIQDKKGEFNIIEEDDYIDDESKEFLMKRINDDIRISVYKRIKELGLTSEHLENKEVVNYIIDDKKYKKMERGRFLFMDSKEIELLNFKRKKKDLRMINAKKGDFKRMEQIEFLEDMFKIKRFDINNIKYRKLKAVKNKLIKNIPKLIIFFEGDASTKRLKDNMSSRINSIKEDYQLKKWLADIYNSYDRFITYKIIKKENNNVFEGFKISSKKKLLYETLFKTTILSMN